MNDEDPLPDAPKASVANADSEAAADAEPAIDDGASETPAARFAARLRALRTEAGNPSYRHLARVMNYSPSTIADATAGRRLPTEPVVRAFAAACKADPDQWAELLRAAAVGVEAAGDETLSAATPAAPPETAGANGEGDVGAVVHADGAAWWPARRARQSLTVAGAVVLLLAGYGIGLVTRGSATTTLPQSSKTAAATPSPSYSYPAADGSDPVAAGCAGDARLLDKSPVMHNGVQVGALELKYSPRCHAGWARVYLYPAAAPSLTGTLASVTVTAEDGTSTSIAARLHMDIPNYTNVVQPHGGCLGASAVLGPDTTAPDHAQIACDAPPAPPSGP